MVSSEPITADIINPIDYYNQNCIQEAFDIMIKVKGVKYVSIDAFSVYTNKGDELKRMVVIENGFFVPKMQNGLHLEVDKKYSAFMLLQKFKFKDSFCKAMNYVIHEHMGIVFPYVRVGTKYFKNIHKIDRYDVRRTELILWEKTTLLEDYPPQLLTTIQKYNDFTISPDNKSYNPVVNDNYNLYSPFEHEPCSKKDYDEDLGWYWIKTLIEHIFGEQYHLGIRYIKILYDNPKQSLPILVLISEERSTGKTTFVDFLNILFGANMVLINPQDISNQFNGSYADKNIIAIEESRFDNIQATEKLKNLATQKEILVNSKNIRQYSLPFFGKLIITSNDETRFSKVDTPEIRYWVRKVPTLEGKGNHQILADMKKEIPQFLYYLNSLPEVDRTKSRMVFEANEITTSELETVKKESRPGLHKDIEMYLEEFSIENDKVKEFKFTAAHIKEKFFKYDHKNELHYFNKILKDSMKLPREKMQRFMPLEENNSFHQQKTSGTPFVYENKYYEKLKSEADASGVSEADATSRRDKGTY
jgi:hypothetical protein